MASLLHLSSSPFYGSSSLPPRHLNPNLHRRRFHRHCHPFSSSITTKIRSQITSSPSQPVSTPATTLASEKYDWFAHWYPLAPICDLDKRIPHAKTVLGLDVVVWWDREAAQWQVFDDRCPHRLAPLSEGRIDQRGRLQCVYHGWCFDGAGSCKYIPQAPPDGPPVHTNAKACATVYPSFEQNKILWFWPRTDSLGMDMPTKEKPPYVPEVDDPSYTSTVGMRDLPYGGRFSKYRSMTVADAAPISGLFLNWSLHSRCRLVIFTFQATQQYFSLSRTHVPKIQSMLSDMDHLMNQDGDGETLRASDLVIADD